MDKIKQWCCQCSGGCFEGVFGSSRQPDWLQSPDKHVQTRKHAVQSMAAASSTGLPGTHGTTKLPYSDVGSVRRRLDFDDDSPLRLSNSTPPPRYSQFRPPPLDEASSPWTDEPSVAPTPTCAQTREPD